MTDFEKLKNKIQDGSATADEFVVFNRMVDEIVEQEFAKPHEISELETEVTQQNLDSFWRKIDALGRRHPQYKKWFGGSLLQKAAVFVGVCIVAGLSPYGVDLFKSILFFASKETSAPPIALPPSSSAHKTFSIKGPVRHTMPDSSKILIKDGSLISYTSNFAEERTLVLQGEAYFNVTHDSLRRFSINLGNISVTVLGTIFAVRANDNEDSITIRVLHGRVSVHTQQKELTQVGDGEKMTVYRNSRPRLDDGYLVWNRATSLTWKTKKLSGNAGKGKPLVFQNARFEDIAKNIEHIFDVSIHLKNERLKNIRITATFDSNISLYDVLQSLSLAASCDVELIQSDPLTLEFRRFTRLSLPHTEKIIP
ncbi:DUF4974 domain-containing protein [Fulvivirgaceae bacterium PWU5]|uniref:DUF4974 domain-containing protein n=1 Tax=Dawidia cretensis TaxID=2782350 RepID=A0AAP2GTM1_9BACT|nr:FecR domain-containing protein [Dawidia cretensis]MBT1712379.1 DUF4974 domain-containing protein [Dawidia cretensis]